MVEILQCGNHHVSVERTGDGFRLVGLWRRGLTDRSQAQYWVDSFNENHGSLICGCGVEYDTGLLSVMHEVEGSDFEQCYAQVEEFLCAFDARVGS